MLVCYQNQVHQGSQKGMCRCSFKGITICLIEPVRNLVENVEIKQREGVLFWLTHISRGSSIRRLFVQEEKEIWWKARLSFESDGVFLKKLLNLWSCEFNPLFKLQWKLSLESCVSSWCSLNWNTLWAFSMLIKWGRGWPEWLSV